MGGAGAAAHRPWHRQSGGHPDRLFAGKVELQTASSYDYLVINDTVEQAVTELAAILCAEHCRPAERLEQLLHK